MITLFLAILLVISIGFNAKLYRDFCLYRSAYRRVSSMATQQTLLMGALVLAPYLFKFIRKKLAK